MVIPFFLVKDENDELEEPREQKLARDMGRPPWPLKTLPASQKVSRLAADQEGPLIGIIFDPDFFYSQRCWYGWIRAILKDGAEGKVTVPLGNQNPSWREGLDIPLYLTLRGLESASDFIGPVRWIERKAAKVEDCSVVVMPRAMLRGIPEGLTVGELPAYWALNRQEIHIFCEGWLHSFNAIRDAGRRNDLISMCSWEGMVLELGCDAGLMAETCKGIGSRVSWIGVDLNDKRLVQARFFMDMAVKADINLPLPFSQGTKFDRIVCGDVLEHLPYPWDLLTALRQWMNPDGLLIASVPNVGHWSVVEDLLRGRWDETPSGLFCVSHLRFGTKRSWRRWFEKSGWQIIRWEEEKLSLPDEWVVSENIGEALPDRESLETVRYRLAAKIASPQSKR